MDAIDRKIVALLQEDASLSLAQIAHRVGLSQSPCWKRIQRLEKAGVILKRVALISPESIGMGLTVFVSIETGDHSSAWLSKFAQTVTAMPEVMEFHRMAGDIDYMLRVAVPDMQAYDAFYKRLIDTMPLKNVTSRFSMERIKSTTAYPLPAETRNPEIGSRSSIALTSIALAEGERRGDRYAAVRASGGGQRQGYRRATILHPGAFHDRARPQDRESRQPRARRSRPRNGRPASISPPATG